MQNMRSLLGSVACIALMTAPAYGQNAAASDSKPDATKHPAHTAAHRARTKSSHSASAPARDENMIVTGTRSSHVSARSSTSPVDVITAADLKRTGQVDLRDALARTVPSISVQSMGYDTGALTDSIRMRGLNPNYTLVLVDGKRRHTTANLYASAGLQQGSTPVDIDMIPAAAIDHIEVLRDGAAAQYGSDAIAGVVNIILKKTPHGLNISGQTGAYAYKGDGWQSNLNLDGGFSFLGDGYIHLSGQYIHSDMTNRSSTDDRTGMVSTKLIGRPEQTRGTMGLEFGKKLTAGIELYGNATYAHRHAQSFQYYRLPSVLPTLYPNGFSPVEQNDEDDYAATLGLKGNNFLGFIWDLSSTYGVDKDNISNVSSANVGLFEATGSTPTTFHAASYSNVQWTNNLDFHRLVHLAKMPINLALGAEHRYEEYNIGAGDEASYIDGGAAGFAGLQPINASSSHRNVYGGYLDVDVHPVKKLDVDLAGRYETYSDFGHTFNGKIASRYDFTDRIAIRGAISNGFRAPSLAQENYSSMAVAPTSASGQLAVNSVAARALGASPLKPERSTNASGGIVLTPLKNWHLAADVYQINIRDQIIAGGNYTGQTALDAIESQGISLPAGIITKSVSARYFSNGASTRTQGIDITSDYRSNFHRFGNVMWTAAINLNRIRMHHLGTDTLGNPLLSTSGVSTLTTGAPRSKIILNANWTRGNWDANIRQTRWGSTKVLLGYSNEAPPALAYSNTIFYEFTNAPRWTTDLEVGYRPDSHWHISIGANNIFNVRPSKVPAQNTLYGISRYYLSSSQMDFNGAYYYLQASASF
ncbi:TonB-dependent receptor plug domain-containing protein [Gluconobacter wancherniae]|uniref:Ligand-gated channel n=1 Tax=Gluconobacter wancherniae NBRC 103581 TaxID=656744 RepID=A0A511AZC2_9PROT|nr:TonB-dependent receptor [Gluconobacter wancherniae]MBF0853125.1 TonB-dependent receptor [Gluconobacter wancherniae]MBS1093704.1 TonB-dependent receptor [Gluconobacter wancherniae]GBD56157.1 hypothetical protein NBRC103581_00730 [Gluconobacter wancherniae NBRC 103581]GBR63307.1 TonB-dependent outer membrane receptor [Gluconobacter wancherniae NBRC 103581]GEK92942.1 hypothetical protein GWA01_07120 [Gluconobacter wancherniae NBRC 103581]